MGTKSGAAEIGIAIVNAIKLSAEQMMLVVSVNHYTQQKVEGNNGIEWNRALGYNAFFSMEGCCVLEGQLDIR